MKGVFQFSGIVTLGLLWAASVAQAQFTYITTNGTITITGQLGAETNLVIPTTLEGLPVTRIGYAAFRSRNLTSVTFPDSITAIDDWAFARCYDLTGVVLPEGIQHLGEGVFYLCTGLTNFTIPNSVTKIDDWAFALCAYLTEVRLGNSIRRIDDHAFADCYSLTSVSIPDSVKSIGEKAFSSCYSLTNATIGNGVREIEKRAFSHCYTLQSVTFGKGLIEIGDFAFFLCAALRTINFSGDRPMFISSGLFAGAEGATVYYLPGTSGWGPTFDGVPTALLLLPQPVILNSGTGFGVQTNSFGFVISWATNRPVVVEASATLNALNWSPVATNTLTEGLSHFSDPQWRDRPVRYFRVRTE